MKELVELFKTASVGLIVLVVFAYFVKVFLDKRLEAIAGRVTEIAKTSLDLKKSLRNEERTELVTFRVAVETWEYSLQTLLFDFTMLSAMDAQIAPFYAADKKLFLDVRIAAVKVSTYLRDEELEQQLMSTILKIRNTYYPMINATMPRLIDLQTKLIPIDNKLRQFEKSGMQDMTFAPTQKDREEHLAYQTEMTNEMAQFSESLMKEYRSIAEQIVSLKTAVNKYIYRPVDRVDINKD